MYFFVSLAKPAATTPAAATLTPKASTSSVGAASSPVARGGPKGTRGGGTAGGGPTKRKKKSDVARLKAAAAAAAEDSNRSTDTDNDGISWGAPIKRTATPTGKTTLHTTRNRSSFCYVSSLDESSLETVHVLKITMDESQGKTEKRKPVQKINKLNFWQINRELHFKI